MAAHAGTVLSQVPFSMFDLEVPAVLAPVDAAAAVVGASRRGVRSVCVAPGLANAVRESVPRRYLVATSCSQVAGWPGNSLLLHVAWQLDGHSVDELRVPVDASLLGNAAWIARQLRQVAVLCHARGVFANVIVDVEGLSVGRVRELVRGIAVTSVNSVTFRSQTSAVPADLVAAAVDETVGRMAVRVSEAAVTPERILRLLDLGASSVNVTPEQLAGLRAASVAAKPATTTRAA